MILKTYLYACSMLFCIHTNAQVGINTENPKVTLDVTSSPTNLSLVDGFMAPQLKGSELKAKDALYTTALNGALVYVTEALLPNSTTVKTANVTATGYYYFDGSVWNRWMSTKNSTVFKAKVTKGESVLSLGVLVNNYQSINFNVANAEIFSNGSVSPMDANGVVTIQESGIYATGLYFRYGTGVNLAALDLTGGGEAGIRIQKVDLNNVTTILDSKHFSGANIGLGSLLAVLNPLGLNLGVINLVISNTETNSIYKFEKGDRISFQTRLGGLATLNLLSGSEGSFYMYKVSD